MGSEKNDEGLIAGTSASNLDRLLNKKPKFPHGACPVRSLSLSSAKNQVVRDLKKLFSRKIAAK
jgi:hypothetical protein